MYVPITALLMFKHHHDNCYLNIMEHVDINDIIIHVHFSFIETFLLSQHWLLQHHFTI